MNVRIDAGGYLLHGRLYRPNKSGRRLPAALFIRGWSPWLPCTYMDLHARLCARELGIVCLSVQYRGMGSPGNPHRMTRADFFSDVLASYDFLKNDGSVDGQRIYAMGESLGAYMSALLSAERPLRGMLLRAPADFPDEGFDTKKQMNRTIKHTKEWRRSPHGPSESRALEAVRRFSGRVLVVESGRDLLIPRRTVENYLNAAEGRAEHIVMRNAGHGLANPFRQREFHGIAADWLRKNLRSIK